MHDIKPLFAARHLTSFQKKKLKSFSAAALAALAALAEQVILIIPACPPHRMADLPCPVRELALRRSAAR